MIAVAALVIAVVALLAVMLAEGGPDSIREDRAARRLVRTEGNVSVLRNRQEDDSLMGCCATCGRWWSQHPGEAKYCPDGIDAGGLVAVNGPRFLPADDLEADL